MGYGWKAMTKALHPAIPYGPMDPYGTPMKEMATPPVLKSSTPCTASKRPRQKDIPRSRHCWLPQHLEFMGKSAEETARSHKNGLYESS